MTDLERLEFRGRLAQMSSLLLVALTKSAEDLIDDEAAMMFVGGRMIQFGMSLALRHPEWAQAAMEMESASHAKNTRATLETSLENFIRHVPIEVHA